MKLSINNVGPFIYENTIDINGITILAGLNGSGKSTCGKVLYSIFNTFQNIDEKILDERKLAIYNYLRRLLLESNNTSRSKMLELSDFSERLFNDNNFNQENVTDYINDYIHNLFNDSANKDQIERAKMRISEALQLDDAVIRDKLLSNQIENEFGKQFRNLSINDKPASVILNIKNKCISFSYDENGASISSFFPLVKNIFYFDDPNLLDYLEYDIRYRNRFNQSHKNSLLNKLMSGKSEQVSSVDQIFINNQIKIIEERINNICDGNILNSDNMSFRYHSKAFKDGLNISNMATGLKTFALLKMLLKNGYLEENGTVIFDEPEIHLHPEWQKAWAEIIVLLNKEFGIHVLLSTHSSDFLLFLEYYTKKYELKNTTKLYSLEKNSDGITRIVDVSYNWDSVYKKLGMPFIKTTGEFNAED